MDAKDRRWSGRRREDLAELQGRMPSMREAWRDLLRNTPLVVTFTTELESRKTDMAFSL
jgi:hypothetical protein